MVKHLYIHIPFCKSICSYCDFKRMQTNDFLIIENYCIKIINQIKLTSQLKQYETIYIGGGTPNYIPNNILDWFLNELSVYLADDYEFSIECNPEFITNQQALIFSKNKINRVSIGAQSLNNKILKLINRSHNVNHIINSVELLRSVNINNINLDFIYNLPFMNNNDIDHIFDFINKYKIVHISFYALEIKENSLLNKQSYQLNIDNEEQQLEYIKSKFNQLNYLRYEISNWCVNPQYYCKHNLAYWLTKSWKGIGLGAYGFENKINYLVDGNLKEFNIKLINDNDYYFQVLMMGLRLTSGININIEPYKSAYNFYKTKIKYCQIKNNYLSCNNIDILNDTLLELLD